MAPADLNVPVEFHRQSFQINETIERLQNIDIQEDSFELETKLKKKLDEGNRIYHLTPLHEFYASLNTDPQRGLTSEVIISRKVNKLTTTYDCGIQMTPFKSVILVRN